MRRRRQQDWDLAAYRSIRRHRDLLLRPVSAGLASLGVSATAISLLGVALAAVACWALDRHATLALSAFVGALLCDALDGALARRRKAAGTHGKLIDHACDTGTFLLVLLGIARCDLLPQAPLLLAAALPVPLLLLAILSRRSSSTERVEGPSGGFLAHCYKVPVYVAFLLYTAAAVDVLAPAVALANLTALISLALVVATLAKQSPRALRRRSAVTELGR